MGIIRASLPGLRVLHLRPLATQIHPLLCTVPQEVDPYGCSRSTHWPLSSGWVWPVARNHRQEIKEWERLGISPTSPSFVPRCVSPSVPLRHTSWALPLAGLLHLASFGPFGSRSEKGLCSCRSQHTFWLPQAHPVSVSFPFGKFASELHQINPFSNW